MNLNDKILSKAMSLLNKIENLQNNDIKDIDQIIKKDDSKIEIESEKTISLKNNFDSIVDYQKILNNYNKNKDIDTRKIDDVSIVIAFYGLDIDRIIATTRALNVILLSNPQPFELIFIEAQKNQNNRVFSWLKTWRNVKYLFKNIQETSTGLFLKTSLWNFGAKHIKCKKILFIDSDIVFCEKDWVQNASDALDHYDIISIAENVKYENDKSKTECISSIGKSIVKSNNINFTGHVGFTIGMTRKAFDIYNGFEAFSCPGDDTWIWSKILGTNLKKTPYGWLAYKDCTSIQFGLPVKIGFASNNCLHLWHRDFDRKNYSLYRLITYLGCNKPFQDISYDSNDPNVLPTWSDYGKIIKRAFEIVDSKESIENQSKHYSMEELTEMAIHVLQQAKKELFGSIDDQNPLIFATGFSLDYMHNNVSYVKKFYENLQSICIQEFTLVCFTNDINTETAFEYGIISIPFSSKEVQLHKDLWKNEINRKDIKFPDQSTVVWVDMDKQINHKLDVARNDNCPFYV